MLTPLQQRLAALITALPQSEGFALAGGAALIIRGIVDRRTHDLDFFTTDREPVAALAAAVEQAIGATELTCERVRTADGFVRLQVSDGRDICELDFSYDARVRPVERVAGTEVLSIEEFAADKTLTRYKPSTDCLPTCLTSTGSTTNPSRRGFGDVWPAAFLRM